MLRQTAPEVLGKTLIYIPILHSEVDLGGLNESVRRVTCQKLGQSALKRKERIIDNIWTKIELVIDNLNLCYKKVRLYQDGLPVCGREVEIVTELSNAGSRNHKLLFRLMEKGATIMGTESPELLIEEYELSRSILTSGDSLKPEKFQSCPKSSNNSLLRRRDHYIANRINRTLRISETGILFIGMLHSLESLLDRDIRLIYPITQPLTHGAKRQNR